MTAPVDERHPDSSGAPSRSSGAPSPSAPDGRDEVGVYAIETEGMSAWYGSTPAVRNLSMHVPHGSIYGLVGPKGAGKTTTIRMLATLQQPDAGTVLVDGIDVRADPAAVRGRIGYLPDFSGVYESLTVSEYLDFYGAIHQIPPRRRERMAEELLELVDLADQRNNPVKWLSRGRKQQLGLVRCLIHDPQILLLDEPAAGLDPQSRIELREILQELGTLDKTILISSHLLSDLAEMCTHLGVMRDGELLAEGSLDEMTGIVSPNAHLRVHLLDAGARSTGAAGARSANLDVARQLLEAQPTCRQIETEGESTLLATFEGTRQDLAGILEQLVTAGVQVTEFALEHRTLEDVFLYVTEIGAQA